MLTSRDIPTVVNSSPDCNRSFLCQHLEDHKNGEFTEKFDPDYYRLMEERNRLRTENAKLHKQVSDVKSALLGEKTS
ncbi:hypothetical protein LCGC14_1255540 [marine sediment metagenome]|uniref:Uncharacterized protein n=1 Tax=marine sediment metagenome TaxID=412755 RepID=A0A0F9LNE8_9ZZZZ